jgi:hypothetical protein
MSSVLDVTTDLPKPDLCWLLGASVLEKRYTMRKQPGALKTNWPFVSACHAGRLGDHPTPVGSVKTIYRNIYK